MTATAAAPTWIWTDGGYPSFCFARTVQMRIYLLRYPATDVLVVSPSSRNICTKLQVGRWPFSISTARVSVVHRPKPGDVSIIRCGLCGSLWVFISPIREQSRRGNDIALLPECLSMPGMDGVVLMVRLIGTRRSGRGRGRAL